MNGFTFGACPFVTGPHSAVPFPFAALGAPAFTCDNGDDGVTIWSGNTGSMLILGEGAGLGSDDSDGTGGVGGDDPLTAKPRDSSSGKAVNPLIPEAGKREFDVPLTRSVPATPNPPNGGIDHKSAPNPIEGANRMESPTVCVVSKQLCCCGMNEN